MRTLGAGVLCCLVWAVVGLTAGAPRVWPALKVLEFPLYAVALGMALAALHRELRPDPQDARAFAWAWNTERLMQGGIVCLGASINLLDVCRYGWRGVVQAVVLIACTFTLAFGLARRLGVAEQLTAVMASAASICGVSAAVAAAGAVRASKEALAYVVTLIVTFCLPLMFLQPLIVWVFGMSPTLAGAWIGGSNATTAAVIGAATMVGPEAVKVAAVVKMTKNSLIGVVAILLALWWAHRRATGDVRKVRPAFSVPPFVLAFLAMTALATLGALPKDLLGWLNTVRTWAFIAAFLSMGFTLSWAGLRAQGWRPVGVFAAAMLFSECLAFALAWVLFA